MNRIFLFCTNFYAKNRVTQKADADSKYTFAKHPIIALTYFFCLISSGSSAATVDKYRDIIALDDYWNFCRCDNINATQLSFDDKNWEKIKTPHSFNANEDGTIADKYYKGAAWYRYHINLETKPNEHIFIEFDGAFITTDIWLNGAKVGQHKGGYSRFRFDLTPYIKSGDNIIAIRVDNASNGKTAPIAGDFTPFGGIYREVRLIKTQSQHIDMLDYGSSGVYITPSNISAKNANIATTIRVKNENDKDSDAIISFKLVDKYGKTALLLSQKTNLAAKQVTIVNLSGQLKNPKLWHGVKNPYLYSAIIEIKPSQQNTISDGMKTFVGLRDIKFDPNSGLLLNGKYYDVRGPNLHLSMRPGKTVAVNDEEIKEDLRIFDEMGANGFRLVHYQHGQVEHEIADEKGYLLWDEIPLVSAIGDDKEFTENAKQQLRELIRQNYNHPSVMVWGLGNEIYKTDENSGKVLDTLNKIAHEEDMTRPTIYANCCGEIDQAQAMHTDMAASNVYFGWYDKKFEDLGPWLDGNHKKRAKTPLAISEYGAGASIHQHEEAPLNHTAGGKWHPEEYQAEFHENYWNDFEKRPWIWAKFIWVGFDFPSMGRNEGDRQGINDKGLVTYDRKVKKDAYYWYQANWSDKPMVYITSRRFNIRTNPNVKVKLYSNQNKVKLFVNGTEQNTKTVNGKIVEWDVSLIPGENHIIAQSGLIHDEVTWVFQPK